MIWEAHLPHGYKQEVARDIVEGLTVIDESKDCLRPGFY